MKQALLDRLEQLSHRLAEINSRLTDPNVTQDMDAYRKLTKEHVEIEPVVQTYQDFRQTQENVSASKELLSDPELSELAEEEIAQGQKTLQQLEQQLQLLLLPKDPNDQKNVFLEIRAGTGGEESALFAADLLRMYLKYAEKNRWQTEIISESESDLGGYREVIVRVSGQAVYSRLKFESGAHRVQRVPATETQGRVHTSACTVAIIAEAEEIDEIKIPPDDLRIDVYRASGAGGQHVNRTESAVRITHLPTGTVAECQDDRSQHKNRDKAMKVLISRIMDKITSDAQAEQAAHRKSLVGSGDRSERIRTYNFPQGRLTDHRINLTLYKLAQVMEGELDEVLNALHTQHQADQLSALSGTL